MTNELFLARIAENPHLPTPPGLALQVLERVSRPDCTLEQVGKLISCDPALCSNMLKTVNSAFFGLPRTISSIDRALKMLGLKTVRSLVLSLSLPAMRCQTIPAERMREHWRSSVAGAIAARELAIRLRRPDPEDDLVAGLLRDLGMLILHQEKPDAYADLLAQPPEVLARSQCQLEEQLFGVNHAEVGAYLLRRWRLPAEITEPIRYHHDFAGSRTLTAQVAQRALVLHFATGLPNYSRVAAGSAMPRNSRTRQAHLGMNEEQLHAYLEPLHTKMQEFASSINLDIGQCDNYSLVLASATEEVLQLAVENTMDNLRVRQEKGQAEQEAHHWRQTAHDFHREAIRDTLTGVYNRGHFDETLAIAFKQAAAALPFDGAYLHRSSTISRFSTIVSATALATRCSRKSAPCYAAGSWRRHRCPLWRRRVLHHRRQHFRAGLAGMAIRLWKAISSLTAHSKATWGPWERRRSGRLFPPSHSAHLRAIHRRCRQGDVLFQNIGEEPGYDGVARGGRRSPPGRGGPQTAVQRSTPRTWRRQLRGNQGGNTLVAGGTSCLGRLARKQGWISNGELAHVLLEQRRTKKLFGEVAIAKGYLTQAQVYALLAIQKEHPEGLAEALVDLGVLTEEDARRELSDYYQSIQALRSQRSEVRGQHVRLTSADCS